MWRAALSGVAAFAAALVLLVLAGKTAFHWAGSAGWALQPGRAPFSLDVGAVAPRGAAARAGVRAGDRIDIRSASPGDRIFIAATPLAQHPIALTVDRGGSLRRVAVVPGLSPARWDVWVGNVVLLWIAAFAALIGWRRPSMPEARLLSLALSCYVAADALQFLVTPSSSLDVVFSAINSGGVLGGVAVAALVRFTELFGRPLSRARRIVDGLAYAGAALLAGYGIVSAVALETAWLDPVPLYFGMGAFALVGGAQLLVVLAGAYAIAASRGAERQRVTWAVVSLGILLSAGVIEVVLDVLVPSDDMALATQIGVNVVAIVAPVGLTYALLSRRLLDVGFALNRAAVFSTVSLIVVGSFMIIEWALGNWLSTVKQTTSALVGLGLAIALGLSIKFLHKRVDHAIDHVFFRKRHEAEKALLRFADEAPYITDLDTLLSRTVTTIEHHTNAAQVAILRHDGAREFVAAFASEPRPAAVDENDSVLIAMRASREPVDLHRFTTHIAGEYAFPMIARAELIGVLVCGAKSDGEPYAPDEIAAVATVAHAVGGSIDALSYRGASSGATVLALQLEVAALRDDVRELLAALRLAERR